MLKRKHLTDSGKNDYSERLMLFFFCSVKNVHGYYYLSARRVIQHWYISSTDQCRPTNSSPYLIDFLPGSNRLKKHKVRQ